MEKLPTPKAISDQNRFLDVYGKIGTITHACRAVGIDPKRHYEWLEGDPTYPERFKDAYEAAVDSLEVEARRRALGYDKDVVYKGKVEGTVRAYSDVLLIFMLKGARPQKYKDRFEHTGVDGGPIQTEQHYLPIERLSPELRQAMFKELEGIGELDELQWGDVLEGNVTKDASGAKLIGSGTVDDYLTVSSMPEWSDD